MNLDANPTREQLRELLAGCDDTAGRHLLWVNRKGDVGIDRLQVNGAAQGPVRPDVQISYEVFLAGNEYVGAEAAADDEWVTEVFERLCEEWQRLKGAPGHLVIPLS
jgi:hypothetical protein